MSKNYQNWSKNVQNHPNLDLRFLNASNQPFLPAQIISGSQAARLHHYLQVCGTLWTPPQNGLYEEAWFEVNLISDIWFQRNSLFDSRWANYPFLSTLRVRNLPSQSYFANINFKFKDMSLNLKLQPCSRSIRPTFGSRDK